MAGETHTVILFRSVKVQGVIVSPPSTLPKGRLARAYSEADSGLTTQVSMSETVTVKSKIEGVN